MKPSGSLVLCYHRVAEGVDDPFRLCVSPKNFAAHLDEIALHCEPSSLAELSTSSRRPRVVVTLDDGYVDNLTNALPIAEARGIPLTVFVTSGAVGSTSGFWWDRLGTLLSSRPSEIYEICLPTAKGAIRIGLNSSKPTADLLAVRHHLWTLPVGEIHHALDAVSEQWATSASPPNDARSLTSSELVELATSEFVTIGAHTVDHVWLRGLSAAEQEQTIFNSKKELELLSGEPISHFAYPYGGSDSFDDYAVAAVRSAGFETACTTVPGNATPSSDPYRLPRRVVMNWGRFRFRAAMQRWRLVPQH